MSCTHPSLRLHSVKLAFIPLNKKEVSNGLLGSTNQSAEVDKQVDKPQPTRQAFDALDAALSTPSRAKYRRKIEKNYDLEGSPTFTVWKKLYKSANPSNVNQNVEEHRSHNSAESSQQSQPEPVQKQRAPNLPSSSDSSILKDILTYPNIEPKVPSSRVNVKRTIPNFVSGPTSKQILLDEKLKKARQLADKQKRLKETQEKREERRKRAEAEKIRKEKKRKNESKKAEKGQHERSNER